MLNKALRTALAATTILTGGIALAATEPATTAPPHHNALVNDFGKLSTDGARAFQDLKLTRLAIYDGRIGDAKNYVAQADAAFAKAQTDDSVFTKAEADMRTHAGPAASGAAASGSAKPDGNTTATTASNPGPSSAAAGSDQDVTKPIAWLPVDNAVSLNEDFAMQPAKAKAVAEANKSLAQGDRKGAADKLKLADVDVNDVTAVVPIKQTLNDVHDAAQLIGSGKYYEGSQKLRAVQDSAIFLVSDMSASPQAAGKQANSQANQQSAGAPATSGQSGAASK